jgi:hypothetical protein
MNVGEMAEKDGMSENSKGWRRMLGFLALPLSLLVGYFAAVGTGYGFMFIVVAPVFWVLALTIAFLGFEDSLPVLAATIGLTIVGLFIEFFLGVALVSSGIGIVLYIPIAIGLLYYVIRRRRSKGPRRRFKQAPTIPTDPSKLILPDSQQNPAAKPGNSVEIP